MSTPRYRLPIATFVNMLTIIVGSFIGLFLQQLFTEDIELIIFQAIGLGSLVIGIQMALKIPDGYLLIFIFSLIIGGVIGALIGLDAMLAALGDSIKAVFKSDNERFTEGMVTAFLLFCIGSLVIIGAIEEGLKGKRELLYIKATLDGVTSIAFASTYGIGVIVSIVPLLIIQGGITVLASRLQYFFTETLISALTGVGGALVIGIGINLIPIGKVNLENLLPSLIVIVILTKARIWWNERNAGKV